MKKIFGTGHDQVSVNSDLGTAAFIDAKQLPVSDPQALADSAVLSAAALDATTKANAALSAAATDATNKANARGGNGGDAATNNGYLNIPQNSKSANYTLVLSDAGKHILHPSADTTARTLTIPANSSVAFPIGTAVTFVNQSAGGVITIAITSDTMRLAGAGTTGSRLLDANGVATAIKITTTEWIISGVNLS
jgi:hypothetical protein